MSEFVDIDFNLVKSIEMAAFRGHFRLLILSILEKSRLYGYQILKRIEEIIGERPRLSTVYTLLKELEEGGLISSYRMNDKDKVYSITEKGKNVLMIIRSSSKHKFEGLFNRIFS